MTGVLSRSLIAITVIVALVCASFIALPSAKAHADEQERSAAASAYEAAARAEAVQYNAPEPQAVPLAAAAVAAGKFAGKAAAAGFFGYLGAKAAQALVGSPMAGELGVAEAEAEVLFD